MQSSTKFVTFSVLCVMFLMYCFSTESIAGTIDSHKFVLADDGAKDASFAAFRVKLLDAIRRHDEKFIEDILSPNVQTALGGGSGKDEFLAQWGQLLPDSRFWMRMQRVVEHGAQLDHDEFHCPAISFDECGGEHILGTVWNKHASLFKQPKDSSRLLQVIDDQQVILLEPGEPAPIMTSWVKVQTKNGITGYMKATDIYSGYDEFATFKKLHQKWCLTWFGFAGL